ncbi:MAG: hypothetical protein CYPHOPRED_003597 [Cyphobasidiales sp. Tagirdzhanova-0007]|nr:MAG: hypothetical protein CYPHOPRED_003597 [Cyphobasidiales sp. Tagirdzhanova-0007]
MASAIERDADLPICRACATQYSADQKLPDVCPVCADDRHAIPPTGQEWTSLRKLKDEGMTNEFKVNNADHNILYIVTEPKFAIGQSPFLVKTADGWMMLESGGFVDEESVAHIQQLVRESGQPFLGISISHPHWYNASTTWARALGCRVYANELDKAWWMRKDSINEVPVWITEKRYKLGKHATILHCGGHFEGSSVTYIERPGKAGLLCAGDTIMVGHNAQDVSFMYSYTNWIPLKPEQVQTIWDTVSAYDWTDIYGAWPHRYIVGDGRERVMQGAKRWAPIAV